MRLLLTAAKGVDPQQLRIVQKYLKDEGHFLDEPELLEDIDQFVQNFPVAGIVFLMEDARDLGHFNYNNVHHKDFPNILPILVNNPRSLTDYFNLQSMCDEKTAFTSPIPNDLRHLGVAIHSRFSENKSSLISVGPIEIDVDRHRIRIYQKEHKFQPNEFDILTYLAKNRGRAISTFALSEATLSNAEDVTKNLLSVYICRIRKKLADAGIQDVSQVLQTRRGYGYMLSGATFENKPAKLLSSVDANVPAPVTALL